MVDDGSPVASHLVERLGAERAAAIEAELAGAGLVVLPEADYQQLLVESARYRRLAALALEDDPGDS